MVASFLRLSLAAVAAALLSTSPAPASGATPDSVTVPLEQIRLGDQIKYGIQLRLGGGPAKLYEFDTGSVGLYAAYDASWWPEVRPIPDDKIDQHYDSGVHYEAQGAMTTVAIPSDHGDVSAEVRVAQILDGYGGPLGKKDDHRWEKELERDQPPLFGRFFGTMGSDLTTKNGLFAILPQLPDNLSSGFIVQLGCPRRAGPSLILGLTDASRARFRTLVPMQPGDGTTYPGSGLPTYAQQLIEADFTLSRRGTVQQFTVGAVLDTGDPTTDIHQFGDTVIDPALHDGREGIVKPLTRFSVTTGSDVGDGLDLSFFTGRVTGVNRVVLQESDQGYVNLGLIPFLRYDVMFDLERGLVGFAPCRGARPNRLPIVRSEAPR